jgi:hypothetical protein
MPQMSAMSCEKLKRDTWVQRQVPGCWRNACRLSYMSELIYHLSFIIYHLSSQGLSAPRSRPTATQKSGIAGTSALAARNSCNEGKKIRNWIQSIPSNSVEIMPVMLCYLRLCPPPPCSFCSHMDVQSNVLDLFLNSCLRVTYSIWSCSSGSPLLWLRNGGNQFVSWVRLVNTDIVVTGKSCRCREFLNYHTKCNIFVLWWLLRVCGLRVCLRNTSGQPLSLRLLARDSCCDGKRPLLGTTERGWSIEQLLFLRNIF